MKKKVQKKAKQTSDPFALFKEATAKAFTFLITDYGFKYVHTIVHAPECAIKYANATTGVTISYEWGGTPSVVLSRLKPDATDYSEAEQIGLKFLVMECCPHVVGRLEDQRLMNQGIDEALLEYAALLRECGHDILIGDFQIFPKLMKLLKAEERKVNLQMFGSATGETRKKEQ